MEGGFLVFFFGMIDFNLGSNFDEFSFSLGCSKIFLKLFSNSPKNTVRKSGSKEVPQE